MYTINKRFLLNIGSTGDPAAQQAITVPIIADDVYQQLSVWLYTPGENALGAGSLVVRRNGEIVSSTAFAGNSIVVPVSIYTIGADFELGILHPPSTRTFVDSVYNYDAATAAFVEDKTVAKYGAIGKPMPLTVTVTNTDAVRKQLLLQWVALGWRV
jgi:hypothetical protein